MGDGVNPLVILVILALAALCFLPWEPPGFKGRIKEVKELLNPKP